MIIKVLASSSEGNCYLISDGKTKLLIEAGIPFKVAQKALNFQVSGLSAVLISHFHGDHSAYIRDFIKAGVDCYMLASTAKEKKVSGHRVKIIEAKKQFAVGSWSILPFDVVHDVECLGFLLASKDGEKLVYITDTPYCKYRFKGLDYILIEANYSERIINQRKDNDPISIDMKRRIIKNHFSLENVKKFLQANDLSRVQSIYLLHLSDSNSNAQMFKREIQQITGKEVYIAKK